MLGNLLLWGLNTGGPLGLSNSVNGFDFRPCRVLLLTVSSLGLGIVCRSVIEWLPGLTKPWMLSQHYAKPGVQVRAGKPGTRRLKVPLLGREFGVARGPWDSTSNRSTCCFASRVCITAAQVDHFCLWKKRWNFHLWGYGKLDLPKPSWPLLATQSAFVSGLFIVVVFRVPEWIWAPSRCPPIWPFVSSHTGKHLSGLLSFQTHR